MNISIQFAQVVVAVSVLFVWTFRFHNVLKEFSQFGLSDLTRNLVGAAKIALSTLLIVGIWYPAVVMVASFLMALLMVGAQFHHFQAKNPMIKRLPSLILMILSFLITYFSA